MCFVALTIVFAPPLQAQQDPNLQQLGTRNIEDTTKDYTPLCSLTNGALSSGSFVGCIALVVHFVFFQVPSYFAAIMGKILDFFLGFTIDSNTYDGGTTGDAIRKGWVIVRDIANIFFIVFLIYAAIATIFNYAKVSYKTIVGAVIINAILINFSLFAVKFVVDISNIAAHVFYNQIVVEDTSGNIRSTTSGYVPLSEGIVSAYDPQRIMASTISYLQNEDSMYLQLKNIWQTLKRTDISETEKATAYQNFKDSFSVSRLDYYGNIITFSNVDISREAIEAIPDDGTTEEKLRNKAKGLYVNRKQLVSYQRELTSYAGKFILVSIIAGIVSFFTGLMFFRVAFVFLGRTVGLFITMIFSPFAFMSRKLPFVSGISTLGWEKWAESLFKYLIVVPLFVFFLYIIHKFVSSDFYSSIVPNYDGNLLGTILAVCLPFGIIYVLIEKAKKLAVDYGGEFSDMIYNKIKGTAGLIGGAAIGVATGGAAILGTRAAGVMKVTGATRASLEARKAAGGWSGLMARTRLGTSDWLQKKSFDASKTKAYTSLAETVEKQTGVKLKRDSWFVNTVGLGSKKFEGGIEKMKEREEKETKKKIESIKTDFKNDKNAAAFWQTRFSKLIEREAEQRYEDELIKEGKTKKDIETMKKDGLFMGTRYTEHKTEAEKALKETYGEVKNNKDLTQALRIQYAQMLLTRTGNITEDFLKEIGIPTAIGLAGVGLAAAPLSVFIGTDQGRKRQNERDAAQDYINKTKKERSKKKEKTEKEKQREENLKEELKAIEESLKKIYEEEVKTNTTLKGKSSGSLTEAEKLKIIEKKRREYQDKIDILNSEVEIAQQEYRKIQNDANKRNLEDAIAMRNAMKAAFESIDPQKKRRAENDLDKLQKDQEQRAEKEKEKEEKAKGGDKEEKKKDDGK